MAGSSRSISARTSSSEPHSAGVFILYDYPMRHPIRHTLLLLASVLTAGAQTLIDNDQVRVLKVVDQPHVKTKPHEHKINRVMVYLDAGKQEFVSGGKTTPLQYKAGEALWSPAGGTHVAEMVCATPVRIV